MSGDAFECTESRARRSIIRLNIWRRRATWSSRAARGKNKLKHEMGNVLVLLRYVQNGLTWGNKWWDRTEHVYEMYIREDFVIIWFMMQIYNCQAYWISIFVLYLYNCVYKNIAVKSKKCKDQLDCSGIVNHPYVRSHWNQHQFEHHNHRHYHHHHHHHYGDYDNNWAPTTAATTTRAFSF